ncbi:glutamine-rich protein 2 [Tenrec ecaudatus]|uniref:glutamine-rich protein 2 n=1 Tax=Tenrec ecaudatus TaxID=94439 RepID=UPI003F59226A
MAATKVSLRELADLAIGTPEVGAVNFTALHTLLVSVLQTLQIQDTQIHFQPLVSEESSYPGSPRYSLSTPQIPPTKEKKRSLGKTSSHMLESQMKDLGEQVQDLGGQVQDLDRQLRTVENQVQSLVSHVEFFTTAQATGSDLEPRELPEGQAMGPIGSEGAGAREGLEKHPKPSTTALTKLMAARELTKKGMTKSVTPEKLKKVVKQSQKDGQEDETVEAALQGQDLGMLQDVFQDINALRASQQLLEEPLQMTPQKILEMRVDVLEKQIKDRDNFLNIVGQKLSVIPVGEDVTMVTWEELEQAITDGWKTSQAPGVDQRGLVQPGVDQRGVVQPGVDQRGLVQPGVDQRGLVQPGVDQRGLVQPGVDQRGLVQPGVDQRGLVQPGVDQRGLVQPGVDQRGLVQPGVDQRGLVQPGVDQRGLVQPGVDQRGLVQPGVDQRGLVQPGVDQRGLVQPGVDQRGLVQPGVDQRGLVQPGVDQRGLVQPGVDQHGLVQPGVDQRGLVQPGVDQRGLVQPGVDQRGLVQPGVDQRGLVQPGVDQRGLVQPGVDQRGLVQPGVDQRGLVQPRVDQRGLVQPGVDQRGLVQPGVDQRGLVQPGVDQRGLVQPGVDQHGLVQPGVDQRGLVQPGVDQRGLVQPGVDQRGLVQPGVDQRGLVQPGVDQRGLVQPGVDQRGLVQPGVDQRGLVQPGVDQRGFVQPGVDQRGLVQPGVDQRGLVQPGVDQRGLAQPGVDQRGLAQPGVDQRGLVQPGVDQRGLVQPGVGQRGLVQPGVDQRGLVQPGTVQRGLVQPGVDQRGLAQPGVAQRGLVQPGVDQRGLVQPGVDQRGLVQPGVDQRGLVQPGVDQRGLVQPGVDQRGLVQPAVDQRGLVQPGVAQRGLVQPGVDQRGLVQPGVDQRGLVQPGVDQRGLVQPAVDQRGLVQPGVAQRGLVQPGVDQRGLVQPGVDQRGLVPPGVAQHGLVQPGVAQRGLVQPGVDQRGLVQPGVDQRGLVQPGVAQRGLVQPGVAQRGLVQPGVDQRGLVQPGVDQRGLVQPGVDQRGLVQPGVAQRGLVQPGVAQRGLVQPGTCVVWYSLVQPSMVLFNLVQPSVVCLSDMIEDSSEQEHQDSLDKLSPSFPIAVETFRLMGEVVALYLELKDYIRDLDEEQAGQTDLEKIQYVIAQMVKKSVSTDLQEQMKGIKALTKEIRQEKAKVDRLQRILEGDGGRENGKEMKTGQLSLQLGILRDTVADIEKELAELRESQERGKVSMEHSVSEASLYLQDQLDKLRTIIESMLTSSSALLSMSMGPHKPPITLAPDQIDPEATCPACSLDLGHQVSTLVQRYEQLQDMVNNLASTRPSKKAKLQSQDEELLGRVQSAILQVQGDCEKLNITTSHLIEDHRQKQKEIDVLYQGIEKLEREKANRDHLEMEIDVKADKSALAGKVSRIQFDATTEQLNHMMQELVARMSGQEQDWQKMLDKLLVEMDSKLDRLELDPVKQLLEDRWKSLRKQLKERSPLFQADEAAIMRRQLLAHFHCLSCDRPLETPVSGQIIPVTPVGQSLPGHRSSRPYTIYELEQVRQQSRNLKLGSAFPRAELGQMERSVGRLRSMHSKMLMDIEKVQLHFGGSVKASSQMIRELLQSQCLGTPCYKRVLDLTDYTYSSAPRRCGGSHTLTYPYRRTRLQHLPQGLLPTEEIQIARKHDEVDILGLDGHIYKGRMDTRLPGILTKEPSGIVKHKSKPPSRGHLHRQQSLSGHGQLPLRPQSAQTMAGNNTVLSRQRADRPVSSEGRLSEPNLLHPTSPTETARRPAGSALDLQMHLAVPPQEGMEEPTRGPRATTR